ncbi:MAG TPA: TfoX/Sxy family protein [Bacteroidia bacterium]|jgi:TfoX/Sxy family transcriptional regulator of competence genes|nr:TfoX/Sxy family protein [Bacteroidia bacterium]HRS40100.1 TfoX/Sxy family protein [Bacteroidia bacterium]HRU60546.1 TfoX/Sxy family protein [Bacteroidia bacterium]
MPYNEKLADRARAILAESGRKIKEKKMFGGLCFMVNDKMCIGVEQDRMMVRLDPGRYEEALDQEGAAPMDFTGKVMKGFIFVDANTLTSKPKLNYWIKLALEYNKVAKKAKKKK